MHFTYPDKPFFSKAKVTVIKHDTCIDKDDKKMKKIIHCRRAHFSCGGHRYDRTVESPFNHVIFLVTSATLSSLSFILTDRNSLPPFIQCDQEVIIKTF